MAPQEFDETDTAVTLVDDQVCSVDRFISDFTHDKHLGSAIAILYSIFRLTHSSQTYCEFVRLEGVIKTWNIKRLQPIRMLRHRWNWKLTGQRSISVRPLVWRLYRFHRRPYTFSHKYQTQLENNGDNLGLVHFSFLSILLDGATRNQLLLGMQNQTFWFGPYFEQA